MSTESEEDLKNWVAAIADEIQTAVGGFKSPGSQPKPKIDPKAFDEVCVEGLHTCADYYRHVYPTYVVASGWGCSLLCTIDFGKTLSICPKGPSIWLCVHSNYQINRPH